MFNIQIEMEEIKKSNEKSRKTNNSQKQHKVVQEANKLNVKTKKSNSKTSTAKTNVAKNVRKQKSNTKKSKNENLKPMIVNQIAKAIVKVEERPLAIKEEFSFKKENLKIIPLGGIEEIGKNITVFEYGNDIVLVDCGVAFPEDDMLGIDLVIPDFTYLVKNKEKIRGLVITHGHEDHIGSIAYLLKEINVPIYATKLTIGLI